MSIGELINAPIEITLGGKKLKIQRLTISEIFTPAETKVQQDYIRNVQDVAKVLSGKDKSDFLLSALKDVPKGAELDKQSIEYMSTPQGVASMLLLGFNKCQVVTEAEIADLMLNANEEELGFIRSFLSGETEEKKREANLLKAVAVNPAQPNP